MQNDKPDSYTTDQPSDWTVAGERDRGVEIVRSYLSARNGIRLARHPHGILEEIIDRIRSGAHV